MNITELIERLQCTLEDYGDLDVVVSDYNGGEDELRDSEPEVENVGNSETRVVVIRGRGIY